MGWQEGPFADFFVCHLQVAIWSQWQQQLLKEGPIHTLAGLPMTRQLRNRILLSVLSPLIIKGIALVSLQEIGRPFESELSQLKPVFHGFLCACFGGCSFFRLVETESTRNQPFFGFPSCFLTCLVFMCWSVLVLAPFSASQVYNKRPYVLRFIGQHTGNATDMGNATG